MTYATLFITIKDYGNIQTNKNSKTLEALK